MARASTGRSIASSCRGLVLAPLLALAAGLAAAQGAGWSAVRGEAADLAAASADEVYAAGADGALWRWIAGTTEWTPLPGRVARVAAAAGMRLWIVAPDGALARWAANGWIALGAKAHDVAVDASGNAYAALDDGRLARWTADGRGPELLAGRNARRVAVEPDGTVWIVTAAGGIERPGREPPAAPPARAHDLAAGGGVVLAATDAGTLRWDAASGAWHPEPGAAPARAVAIGGGISWLATEGGAIRTRAAVRSGERLALDATATQAPGEGISFRRGGLRGSGSWTTPRQARASQRGAASVTQVPPARVTDPAPFEFVDTLSRASSLAIGEDGSVFAIGLDGGLGRWSNARRAFVPFPGSLVRIAVDPGGSPWGINQAGRIFRHTGSDWRQVRGTASDLAIASSGRVMAASATGALARYDPASDGFVPVPGELFFLALAPDGTPWGLLRDGTVLRCAATPCDIVGQGARDISIGPDGSVFIVTQANELRRFNAGAGTFEIIPVPGHVPASVAVGPFGRPWVVTTAGQVLSSRFFPRDESLDLQTAAGTVSPTTGTGDGAAVLGATFAGGGFAFSKNMQFTDVSPFCNTDLHIGIGAEGSVVVLCEAGGMHVARRWDGTKKTFVGMGELPTSFGSAVDVDAEGRLWLLDGAADGRLYRQKHKNGTAYDLVSFPPGSSLSFRRDFAIGPDGALYVINRDNALYRRAPDQASFSRLVAGRFARVAVGIANDVWVVDLDDVLYQIVSGKLERRAGSTFDVGGGADGSIYAVQQNAGDSLPMLYKWNASTRRFDRVNRSATHVDVAPNGRPWVIEEFALRVHMAR